MLQLAGCTLVAGVDRSAFGETGAVVRDASSSDERVDCMPSETRCGDGRDDDCDGRVDGADPDCAPAVGDSCASPPALELGREIRGDTTSLRNDVRPGCVRETIDAPDAVWSLDVTAPSDLVASTFGSGYDTVLALRGRCTRADEELACANDANARRESRIVYRGLQPGSYALLLDGDRMPSAGPFRLHATLAPSPAQRGCGDALDVTGGATIRGRTGQDGAEDQATGSCGGENAAEEVYRFELSTRTRVQIHTAGSSFDTVVYLRRERCEDNNAEIACNDDASSGGGPSRLDLTLDPGRYFLFVDGFGGAEGRYQLVVYFG
ncbi:MAG: PPC domain-containing protein [Myxococcota bacterium]|nr:PPC domain-containing protein [Myxococcota bacterium]